MKIPLYIIRIIVGVLFIFSGLIKANDPMGLSYKMQEFFEVWGLQSLDSYTLVLAVVMNTFEIVAGVAVLVGWQIRIFSRLLLLLIIFFTFLTGYALFSGKIKTCGCFGDCIPLTPKESFIKDLVLLILIVVIFIKQNTVSPFLNRFAGSAFMTSAVLFCIVSQWYVLKHLPVIDCLAYKKGNNIIDKMKIPDGAVADSFAIKFRYKTAGKEVEFGSDNFPDDFNDSTYQFVDRVQELVRPGTATAAISDFILYGESGEDTTMAILNQQGYYVMLLSKDANEAETDWNKNAVDVSTVCVTKKIPFFIVTATTEAAEKQLPATENIHYLKCDATVIKTAGRVNPTYFIMKQANIIGKYANSDYEEVIRQLSNIKQ
ncbi:BT_3928 family protein [Segetibacter koreensis]|uniref:BT_3928 family protein n=1 Tax=Segetibacter koreensis TaxID=398037 RepID=UPI0003693776|nr:BT_3928 family protein [Segetibacter koreensis]